MNRIEGAAAPASPLLFFGERIRTDMDQAVAIVVGYDRGKQLGHRDASATRRGPSNRRRIRDRFTTAQQALRC
jgi:hypothetical protein